MAKMPPVSAFISKRFFLNSLVAETHATVFNTGTKHKMQSTSLGFQVTYY